MTAYIPMILTLLELLVVGLLALVVWELHDFYRQMARLIFTVEKLHHMIWGALGTPDLNMPATPPVADDAPSEPGRIYVPEGWGEPDDEAG